MTVFGLPALQTSAAVLVCIIVLLILTGQLVPRRVMRDRLEDRDRHLVSLQTQSDMWRHAYQTAMTSRREADLHVGELMEVARTATQVLGALPPPQPEAPEIEVLPDAHHAA